MLTVSDSVFPDMAFVIEYSALIPLLLLRLAEMAIVFDKFPERLIRSLGHRHV
jgi:hypothetical protein